MSLECYATFFISKAMKKEEEIPVDKADLEESLPQAHKFYET